MGLSNMLSSLILFVGVLYHFLPENLIVSVYPFDLLEFLLARGNSKDGFTNDECERAYHISC